MKHNEKVDRNKIERVRFSSNPFIFDASCNQIMYRSEVTRICIGLIPIGILELLSACNKNNCNISGQSIKQKSSNPFYQSMNHSIQSSRYLYQKQSASWKGNNIGTEYQDNKRIQHKQTSKSDPQSKQHPLCQKLFGLGLHCFRPCL